MSPEIIPPRQSDAVRGLLLMCLGATMFPFLNTCAKLLTANYPVQEIVWARFVGHFLIAVIIFLPSKGWRLFVAHRPVIQIARSFLLLGSTVFFISAIGRSYEIPFRRSRHRPSAPVRTVSIWLREAGLQDCRHEETARLSRDNNGCASQA